MHVKQGSKFLLFQILDKKVRDNAYDHTKRAQKFVPSWKDKYKWVTYNIEIDKMFGEFCLAHLTIANKNGSFFVGTSNFSVCSPKVAQFIEGTFES